MFAYLYHWHLPGATPSEQHEVRCLARGHSGAITRAQHLNSSPGDGGPPFWKGSHKVRCRIISFPAARRIQTAGLPVCALFISLKCALFTSNHIPWPVSEYLRREREDVLAASPLGRTSVEGCGTYACCSIINELLSPQHTLCLLPKDDNVRTASCIWMVLCAAAVPVPVAYTGWFLGGNLSLYWYNKNRLKNSYLFYSAQG